MVIRLICIIINLFFKKDVEDEKSYQIISGQYFNR